MRHTFATLQIEKGTDLKQVQELLGHAVLAMTADTYKHVVEQSRAKQKAINRMDDPFDVDVDEFNADEPFKGRKKAQS
jgi:integrase